MKGTVAMKWRSILEFPKLEYERKFIGMLSFPFSDYENVRLEIYKWILDCEGRIARDLRQRKPTSIGFAFEAFQDEGVFSSTTGMDSRIEYATAKGKGIPFTGIRYAHWGADRKAGRMNDGFLTTFIFEKNDERERLRCWVTLQYLHMSRGRQIAPSVPRIFKILKELPEARVYVDQNSGAAVRDDEWRWRPRYDGVCAMVSDALKKEREGRTPDSICKTVPICETAPADVPPQAESVLKAGADALGEAVARCLSAIELWTMRKENAAAVSEAERERMGLEAFGRLEASVSHSEGQETFERQEASARHPESSGTSGLENSFTSPNADREGIDRRDLEKLIYHDTRSVALMDEFERVEDGKRVYERLVLKSEFYFWNGMTVCGDYVVERLKPGQEADGDITFTDLKRGEADDLRRYVSREVDDRVKTLGRGKTAFIKFARPYLLRAQTTLNREYGALYGETNRYGVIGIMAHRF